MKMGLIAKENKAENSWFVFDSFRKALTKFNPFSLICVSLFFRICILYGNNVKSLYTILCADAFECRPPVTAALLIFVGIATNRLLLLESWLEF